MYLTNVIQGKVHNRRATVPDDDDADDDYDNDDDGASFCLLF